MKRWVNNIALVTTLGLLFAVPAVDSEATSIDSVARSPGPPKPPAPPPSPAKKSPPLKPPPHPRSPPPRKSPSPPKKPRSPAPPTPPPRLRNPSPQSLSGPPNPPTLALSSPPWPPTDVGGIPYHPDVPEPPQAPPSPPPSFPPHPPPQPRPPPVPPLDQASWRQACIAQASCMTVKVRYFGGVNDTYGVGTLAPFQVCMHWDASREGCGYACDGTCGTVSSAAPVCVNATRGSGFNRGQWSTTGAALYTVTGVSATDIPAEASDVGFGTFTLAGTCQTFLTSKARIYNDPLAVENLAVAYAYGPEEPYEQGLGAFDYIEARCIPLTSDQPLPVQSNCSAPTASCSIGWYSWRVYMKYTALACAGQPPQRLGRKLVQC